MITVICDLIGYMHAYFCDFYLLQGKYWWNMKRMKANKINMRNTENIFHNALGTVT